MTISLRHNNRSAHNWLVYSIGDAFLKKYEGVFKGKLFDFGAGEAPYRDYLLQFSDEYVSVDWSKSMHNTSADIVADLNCPLPIDSEVADTVVSFSVLEHLSEPQNMINEAYRILKPGGSFLLQVPWQWQVHEAPYDFFRYTPFGLNYLCESAGFADVVVTPQAGFFTTMVLKFNYFTRRRVGGPKFIKGAFFLFLMPFWTLGQLLSPILDKLDGDWQQEAFGFYVVATKR